MPSRVPAGSQTRAERRLAARARRTRVMVAGSALVALLVVAAWFPASALLQQRRALASGSSQLRQVSQQDQALRLEEKRLSSSSEISRIARQQYQLVEPGQQAYEILPPNGDAPGSSYSGDPGAHQPVTPSGASELPPGALPGSGGAPGAAPASGGGRASGHGGASSGVRTARPASASGTGTAGASSGGVVGRIVRTLEFWR